MNRMFQVLDSTVGQKVVTAATGLGLIGFVIAHLLGNLQMFAGPDAINIYAEKLQKLGPLLWIARLGLIALVGLHIAMTVRLTLRNRRAAMVENTRVVRQASTWSSRWMAASGSLILLFIIFHLLHFTMGVIQPATAELEDSVGRHDVYTMVIRGFDNWAIAAFYIVSMLVLMSHLSHATFSVLQTLGIVRMGKDTPMKLAAKIVGIALALGFISIPCAVLFGWLSV